MHIDIDNLSKSFRSLAALKSVSLTIDPGQIVVLLGSNGAGKTTLLRCLAGIVDPDAGEIRYDGELFRRDRIDLRRRFCFMPDFPYFDPEMTVIRHISMVLDMYEVDGEGTEDRVIELLNEFDVLELAGCKIGTLSRGQSYKAALAALLAVDPEVWLLDEPFASGMDPRGLSAFRRHSLQAVQRERTVIYSTQIVDVVEGFADRVCVIDRGELLDLETMDDFQAQLERPSEAFKNAIGELKGHAP